MIDFIFLIITILAIFLLYFGAGKDKRILPPLFIWLLLYGGAALSGFFQITDAIPPRFLFLLLGSVLLSVWLIKLIDPKKFKVEFILGLHIVRFPIELILYQLYLEKEIPLIMTFKGWNFDILISFFAVLILIYMKIWKKNLPNFLIWSYNLIGLITLIIIVSLAILSSLSPLQQIAFDQPNIAVLRFPFVYLPTIVVPIVFLSHLVLFKKIIKKIEIVK